WKAMWPALVAASLAALARSASWRQGTDTRPWGALARALGEAGASALAAAAFVAIGFVLVVFLAISMLLSGQETAKPATSGLQGRGRISMSRLHAGQAIRVGGAARRPASYARSRASLMLQTARSWKSRPSLLRVSSVS